jgi:hypothetical protein
MAELGLLTPDELFEALNSNRLPTKEDSMESQRKFINDRDEGLYFPLVGGSPVENPAMEEWVPQEVAYPELQKPVAPPQKAAPKKAAKKTVKKSQTTSPNIGRPSGTKGRPQTREKTAAKETFSFENVKNNIIKSQDLEKTVQKELRKLHKKTRLSKTQKEIAQTISHIIIANETPDKWNESVAKYCKKPIDQNIEQVKQVEDIAFKHQLDTFMASMLFHSTTEKKNEL